MPIYRFKYKGLREDELRGAAGNVPPLTISDIGNAGFLDIAADATQLGDLVVAMSEQGFVYSATNPVTSVGEESAAAIQHDALLGVGTNTHVQIDTHLVNTSNPHLVTATQAGADPAGTALAAVASHESAGDPHPQYLTLADGNVAYALISQGVTNGNSHNHDGGDGAQINHTSLGNVGTTTHTQIDTFIGTKAAASGLASLDTTSRVVQAANTVFDGTAARSASPTAGANIVPVAGAGGTIAVGFIPIVPISSGGTGQVTKTSGFDALSPTTSKGDLIASDGTNAIRVGVGSDGQVLTASSGQASGVHWTTPSSGSIPVTCRKTATQAFTSTTAETVTSSSLSLAANTVYKYEYFMIFGSNAVTNGIRVGANVAGDTTFVSPMAVDISVSNVSTNAAFAHACVIGVGPGSAVLFATSAFATTNNFVRCSGVVITGAGGGSINLLIGSETAGSTITLQPNSIGVAFPIS